VEVAAWSVVLKVVIRAKIPLVLRFIIVSSSFSAVLPDGAAMQVMQRTLPPMSDSPASQKTGYLYSP